MRPHLLAALCLGALASPVYAQQQPLPQRPAIAAQDGGARETLHSIVIPPIPNEPFTATLAMQWSRYTPGGGTVTLVNQRRIARDSQGRLYEERWWLVPEGGNFRSRMNWIQIADPVARTLWNCNVFRRVCTLLNYNPAHELAAANPRLPVSHPLGNSGNVQVDNLGDQIIDGMDTTGTRVTLTLNPGVIGNDQPVQEIRETWHSSQLGMNLLSIRSGPMIGKETFTVTDLDPSEPDPALFAVPSGYSVRDLRHLPAPIPQASEPAQ